MRRKTVFHITALLFLLLTGVELFACEMIEPQNCESFGFPNSGGDNLAGDNCICCCTHVVVTMATPLSPIAEQVTGMTRPAAAKPRYRSIPVYHPPKF